MDLSILNETTETAVPFWKNQIVIGVIFGLFALAALSVIALLLQYIRMH